MAGIAGIANDQAVARATQATFSGSDDRTEIFFKPGDAVYMKIMATGAEDDDRLDEYRMYSIQRSGRWTAVLQEDDMDMSDLPKDARAQHKFGMWGFVFEIDHATQPKDRDNPGVVAEYAKDWEIVKVQGRTMFRETVNDYRIVSFGFGKDDRTWNQLAQIHYDWNDKLDSGTIRIVRTGEKLSTVYDFTALTRTDEIPAERIGERDELKGIGEFMIAKYGSAARVEEVAKSSEMPVSESDDLPW
jgi:hypothetical protein